MAAGRVDQARSFLDEARAIRDELVESHPEARHAQIRESGHSLLGFWD
jgi:hypothetical protein